MIPTFLFLGLFAYSQAQNCVPETQPIGSFGQGVPRIDGTMIQPGSPYSMIDIDGAAQMPAGIITGLEYRVFRIDRLTFQIWRPQDIRQGRFNLIASVELNPTEVEEVLEMRDLNIPIQAKDRWGFSYNGNGLNVPVKYSVTLNEPNEEPYMALECTNGCAAGGREGDEVVFPTQKVQKQFRMRAMLSVVVSTCPPPTPTTTLRPRPTPPPTPTPTRTRTPTPTPTPTRTPTPAPIECIAPTRAAAPEAVLLAKVFQNHNPDVRPAAVGELTEVTLSVMIKEIISFDGEALRLLIYMDQRWKDIHFGWCPEDNDHITQLKIKTSDIWVPDIIAHSDQLAAGKDNMAILNSDGTINHVAVYIWDFPCKMVAETENTRDFNCTTMFESWVYTNQEMDYVVSDGELNMSLFQEHPKVQIISTHHEKRDHVYPCCRDIHFPTIFPVIIIRVPKTNRSNGM